MMAAMSASLKPASSKPWVSSGSPVASNGVRVAQRVVVQVGDEEAPVERPRVFRRLVGRLQGHAVHAAVHFARHVEEEDGQRDEGQYGRDGHDPAHGCSQSGPGPGA
jgi:hypothetical protein